MARSSKNPQSGKPSTPSTMKPLRKPFKDCNNGAAKNTAAPRLARLFENDVPDFPRGGKRKSSLEPDNRSGEDDLGSLSGEAYAAMHRVFNESASIRPLEVHMDDSEESDVDDKAAKAVKNVSHADIADENCRKRARKKQYKEREQEIEAAEERLLEKGAPRNTDEFEMLVRASPNCSYGWMKYMEYMLSLADVEKARSIADWALRTINIREESEKLNIWVALFNLENEYGNPPEEAVKKLFQKALQYCDPKRLHLELLGMYERTEQHKLAAEHLNIMIKKFKHSCKVWLRRGQNFLQQNPDEFEKNVSGALICLPQHKRIKFLSKMAILAFKCSFPDKGRTMFEGLLRDNPKRTDLWSVYLDQEIRLRDVDVIRSLFERATSLSLKSRRIKFLFSKYLKYEQSLGEDGRDVYVRDKALEYAKNLRD